MCYDQDATKLLDVIDQCFLGVFVLELVVKIVGLSPARFWASAWNRLDFVLIFTSLAVQVRTMCVFATRMSPPSHLFRLPRCLSLPVAAALLRFGCFEVDG